MWVQGLMLGEAAIVLLPSNITVLTLLISQDLEFLEENYVTLRMELSHVGAVAVNRLLDSPFSDLVDLMMELVKFAIQYMRKAIQKKAKFDIMDLNTN
ncbi:hypothetical protein NC652_022383 [Populus alba x Populus x berolinensis]|nr:hypothetical protein NC652_022383 [Populus alba x Populus x berolinensis]